MTEPRAITIAILAMGGEGGGVLAGWIVDVAEAAGYWAQMTSVPGVAQRTGSTIYYVELFPETGGAEPVLALMPVPGEVDVVIASEAMEAGRAVSRGLVTPDRTTLITSTHRVYSMAERTAPGDGRVDAAALLDSARAAAKRFVAADFEAVARECNSVISAAMLGALAMSEVLPFSRERFEDAIRRSGVGVENSLAAFARGLAAPAVVAGVTTAHPGAADEIIAAGIARLTDYQDRRYAEAYLALLNPIRAADQNGDLLAETARHLALWMSYEDAIRVADLKTRASRFQRIRNEVKPQTGQLLKVHDYLYPRLNEIADILPVKMGRRLLRGGWASALVKLLTRHGRIVQTTGIPGYVQLRMLSRLRSIRRRTLRFQHEHQRIREWIALLPALAAENYALACEVAACPRFLRGYGDTHAHGTAAFDSLIAAVPSLRSEADGAGRFRRLAEEAAAALA